MLEASPKWVAAAVAFLGLWSAPTTTAAESPAPYPGHASTVEAQFRGCESAGWCWFWIESAGPSSNPVRVQPDGAPRSSGDDAISLAVRDRLNALLASMIHQHKRIVLRDLRELGDGTFAASVTVNGVDLASDPLILQLREKATGTGP